MLPYRIFEVTPDSWGRNEYRLVVDCEDKEAAQRIYRALQAENYNNRCYDIVDINNITNPDKFKDLEYSSFRW